MPANRHVILSGCSGGGKSTLPAELAARGFPVVPEPGRRIVAEEIKGDGSALPWVDLSAFAKRAIDVAAEDQNQAADCTGWVFFDRSLIDAAVALQHSSGQPVTETLKQYDRYHHQVFLTPPWPEIYVSDEERQHGFDEAIDEYDRLLASFEMLGYNVIVLPKISTGERADFVLRTLR